MLNNAATTSSVNSLHSLIPQVQPDLNCTEQVEPKSQSTGRYEKTPVSNRKISLSDPYIHASLQTQDLSQTNMLKPQGQDDETKSFASKRKISLDACRDGSSEGIRRDFFPAISSKIPRITSCQKLATYNESGSLDKFRRIYVKSEKLKLPHPEAYLQNSTRLPQIDSFVLNSKTASVCQRDTEKQDTLGSFQSPPTLSAVTDLKPVSAQRRGKKSLAAKLCHLKQHRTEDAEVSLDMSTTTSQDSGNQDGNNTENPCDPVMLNVEPANEEETTLGDWLYHYDACVGKMVYVNRETGLSRYDDPATEETQVPCKSDVTNMAVSVISEMDDANEGPNSLSSLYSKWNNPVFVHPPTVGVDISSGQADGLAVKIHNILFPYRFSKAMIHSMKVIHQVDKKFLACLINTRDEESVAQTKTEANLLVLVDQHAAHERVRLENLVADSYEDDPDAEGSRRLCSSTILPPLEISVTEEELRLLRSCQSHLRSLGLDVAFSQAENPQVFVGKVPLCFMEKESNELRRGRPSVIRTIVEDYLREQIELLRSAGRVRGTLPLTVLKVLASLACHGAIKFNSALSRDECHSLVASLSSCQLPFQCAHGRPSIVPLVDILHLDKEQKDFQKPNLQRLRRMYKAWELYENR